MLQNNTGKNLLFLSPFRILQILRNVQLIHSLGTIHRMGMEIKKGIKILLSVLLPLFVIIPSLVFVIYPKYSEVKIFVNEINISEITRNSWISFLISISPPKTEVRGEMNTNVESIEEMTSNLQPLERKLLEDTDTYLLIPSMNNSMASI